MRTPGRPRLGLECLVLVALSSLERLGTPSFKEKRQSSAFAGNCQETRPGARPQRTPDRDTGAYARSPSRPRHPPSSSSPAALADAAGVQVQRVCCSDPPAPGARRVYVASSGQPGRARSVGADARAFLSGRLLPGQEVASRTSPGSGAAGRRSPGKDISVGGARTFPRGEGVVSVVSERAAPGDAGEKFPRLSSEPEPCAARAVALGCWEGPEPDPGGPFLVFPPRQRGAGQAGAGLGAGRALGVPGPGSAGADHWRGSSAQSNSNPNRVRTRRGKRTLRERGAAPQWRGSRRGSPERAQQRQRRPHHCPGVFQATTQERPTAPSPRLDLHETKTDSGAGREGADVRPRARALGAAFLRGTDPLAAGAKRESPCEGNSPRPESGHAAAVPAHTLGAPHGPWVTITAAPCP
ncbi:hypothetical protein H8959_011254 [Pygathrix nigripes]